MTRTWSDVVQKGTCTSVSKPAIVSDDEASDDEACGTKPMAVKKTVKAPEKLQKKVVVEKATEQNDEKKKNILIDYRVAHNQWGHHGERCMQQMAAVFRYKLIGKSCPCDACGIAKATHSRKSKQRM